MTRSGRAPLLLLVGMHRSGTSLLGSLLPPLGVTLPGELIDGDHHNPEGYYEREDITALQERLLIDLGRWWPSADGVLPLPDGWLEAPCTRAVREQLLQILASEQCHQIGPWAVKDPRTSLLLPLWREVADLLGLPLRLVLGVRDPGEVMLSLVQRDSQPAGMTPWRAQELWWRHNRQVLLDGTGLPLLIVHYDAWFQPTSAGRQLDRLARFCGVEPATDATRAAALGRVRPEHRRSLPQAGLPLALHPRVGQLHQDLLRLARRDPEAADRPRQRLRRSLAAPELTSLEPAAAGSAGEAAALPSSHPWRAAALACAGGDSAKAGQQLQHWLTHGLSVHDLERIQQAPDGFFPSPPQNPSHRALWPPKGRVVGLGTHLRDWKLHAWLQHCPLPPGFELLEAEPDAAAVAALHLASVPTGAPSLTLIAWSALPLILDPHPERARLLQRLGLRAHPLEPGAGTTNWLGREGDLAAAGARLGLPPPAGLHACVAQGAEGGGTPDPLSWYRGRGLGAGPGSLAGLPARLRRDSGGHDRGRPSARQLAGHRLTDRAPTGAAGSAGRDVEFRTGRARGAGGAGPETSGSRLAAALASDPGPEGSAQPLGTARGTPLALERPPGAGPADHATARGCRPVAGGPGG